MQLNSTIRQNPLTTFLISTLNEKCSLIKLILGYLQQWKDQPKIQLDRFTKQYGLSKYHYNLYLEKYQVIVCKDELTLTKSELAKRLNQLEVFTKKVIYDYASVEQQDYVKELMTGIKELDYLRDLQLLLSDRKDRFHIFMGELRYQAANILKVKEQFNVNFRQSVELLAKNIQFETNKRAQPKFHSLGPPMATQMQQNMLYSSDMPVMRKFG